jgi:hypothetical protein
MEKDCMNVTMGHGRNDMDSGSIMRIGGLHDEDL